MPVAADKTKYKCTIRIDNNKHYQNYQMYMNGVALHNYLLNDWLVTDLFTGENNPPT